MSIELSFTANVVLGKHSSLAKVTLETHKMLLVLPDSIMLDNKTIHSIHSESTTLQLIFSYSSIKSLDKNTTTQQINITFQHFVFLTIQITDENQLELVSTFIENHMRITETLDLLAFNHTGPSGNRGGFDHRAEFERIGVETFNKSWRISAINESFQVLIVNLLVFTNIS
jgi:hypothetical protein